MAELISFLIIISAGLFLSELFKQFHLPYVVGLILAGIVIGPFGLNLIEIDPTIDFLGSIGLVFLMFMAGMQIKFSSFKKTIGGAVKFSALNGIIPFVAGFGIATYFGYDFVGAFLLGINFVSSSIAVIIPLMESLGLMKTKLGKLIVSGAVLEDILSLLLFSFFLQVLIPTTEIPLYLYYIIIFISLYALRLLIPKAREFFVKLHGKTNAFEEELRFIFVALIGTVVLFDLLGMHPIIAGFFAGLVLSDTVKNEMLLKKIHALSYGLFIPIFFIVIGAQMDVGVLFNGGGAMLLIASVVLISVIAKFCSGWVGAKINGFSNIESALAGSATLPQLSTSLAVAFVGLEMGIIDDKLITAMIVLSIVTTFLGPILMKSLAPRCERERKAAATTH